MYCSLCVFFIHDRYFLMCIQFHVSFIWLHVYAFAIYSMVHCGIPSSQALPDPWILSNVCWIHNEMYEETHKHELINKSIVTWTHLMRNNIYEQTNKQIRLPVKKLIIVPRMCSFSMFHVSWCVFCSISLSFDYVCMRLPFIPWSIAGVPSS